MINIEKLVRERRSVRTFDGRMIDEEIKEKLSENNLSLGMTFSEELSNAITAEADRAKAVGEKTNLDIWYFQLPEVKNKHFNIVGLK